MSSIRAKNTGPEKTVRKIVTALGYRYRLHRKDLPGRPDLAFIKLKKVIFVHGCFWHRHEGCKKAQLPKSNQDYWLPKLEKNVKRDEEATNELKKNGWDVLVVWECETKELESLFHKLKKFLNKDT